MCKYTLRLSNRKLLEAQGRACCPDSSHGIFFFLPEILRYRESFPKLFQANVFLSGVSSIVPWFLSPEEKKLTEPPSSWQ